MKEEIIESFWDSFTKDCSENASGSGKLIS